MFFKYLIIDKYQKIKLDNCRGENSGGYSLEWLGIKQLLLAEVRRSNTQNIWFWVTVITSKGVTTHEE